MGKIRRGISLSMLAAALAACDSQHISQDKPKEHIEQAEKREFLDKDLDAFVAKYNNGGIEEKDRIIHDLYHRHAGIVKFSYNYPWKGSESYGKVTVGIEGRIGVYYKENGKTVSEFELDNEAFNIGRYPDGIGLSFLDGKTLRVPQGYSVLRIERPLNPAHIDPMLKALQQFAKEHPDLRIDPKSVPKLKAYIIS